MKQNKDYSTIDRRTFCSKCIGITAGISLLSIGLGYSTESISNNNIRGVKLENLSKHVEKNMSKYNHIAAQASFATLNERLNLKVDDSIVTALQPFVGGLGLKGETCGAVIGPMLALGIYFGTLDKENSAIDKGSNFMDSFMNKFEAVSCKDVQTKMNGRFYDFSNAEDTKEAFALIEKNEWKCTQVVEQAVQIALDLVSE